MCRKLFLSFVVMAVLLIVSCKLFDKEDPKPIEVYGCMDSTATNYNPEATIDDGSCDYCKEGSSFILLSTDGGVNWDMRCLKDEIGRVTDISMVDSNNIWLCTYANTNVNILNSQILHTFDGGITWEEQYSYDNSVLGQISFEYIEMFDINNGIALANDGNNKIPVFLKTVDGGTNWVQTTTDAIGISGDIWRRVDFVDVNTGYFYESIVNPQKLYKTTNSGRTWNVTNFTGQAQVLKFYSKDIGIILTYSKAYRTLDGGETWSTIDTTHIGWGIDIEFAPDDPSKVWFLKSADSGLNFYSSPDTGQTWQSCFNSIDIYKMMTISNTKVMLISDGLILIDQSDCQDYESAFLPNELNGIEIGFEHNFDCADDNTIVIPGLIY